MKVMYRACAGIDVHKRDVKVCLIWHDEGQVRRQEVRTYGTMTPDLLSLSDWLREHECEAVALESTSVYWQPVFNLLEGEFAVLLVNPTHIKNVPGRKTDVKDCEWIAELLEHGLLKPSFIPPAEIRDLRDLTRYRRKLVQMRAAEVNRVQKLLEQANIKLASVASDVMGASGRAMLNALVRGEQDPARLADLAKGQLKAKKEQLIPALQGRFRPHHARLLAQILRHIDFLNDSIAGCEADIAELTRPFEDDLARLDAVPGVSKNAAADLLAEIGPDMATFPSHKHLCSWARICPGNNESAGKRRRASAGKGNKWLKAVLVECAHAASRTKNTYLAAQYRRFARKRGRKHAALAVAHTILEAAWFILAKKQTYHDLGPQYLTDQQTQRAIRYHVRRLKALGLDIDVPSTSIAA